MKKYTFEYIEQYFKYQGCELLEKEYKNNSTKMRYKCSCGVVSKITFSDFKQGSRCKKCGDKKKLEKLRYSYAYVKNYFKQQGCELLEKEYKNSKTKMRYKCSCGNISEISFSNFKNGRRCSKCGGTEKFTLEYVKKYFEEQGCELLEKEYTNSQTKIEYRCSCGNISGISFSNFKNGRRCSKCGGTEKLIFKYIKKYFEENSCELLSSKYKNTKEYLKYKCSCGNISKITFQSFQQGNRCKKCGIEKITGKNSPNYNFNKTDEERKIQRKFPEYYKWRTGVYEKNNYTCQCCFQRGCVLNAHHIKNYATNKKLRLDIDNGITLCKDCHIEFHKIYGKKDNNKKQLDEFLKMEILCLKSG